MRVPGLEISLLVSDTTKRIQRALCPETASRRGADRHQRSGATITPRLIPRSRRVQLYAKLVEPLVMSLSNHEPDRSSFDRPVLSEALILRQAQDERRVEGLRMSAESKGSGRASALNRQRHDRALRCC